MMKIRIAATLLALALPLVAQVPATTQVKATQVEATFYKAFYLEKGKRDFEGAMALYSTFLAKAPDHKLAKEAAKQQFRLLDITGKTKARDAFKAKYAKLLGKVGNQRTRPARRSADEGGRPQRGDRGGRSRRGGMRGVMGLMRSKTKIADMSKEQLEELKTGLAGATGMIDRLREMMGDEVADKLEKSSGQLKKALDAGNQEDAQKALDALKKSFPQRGRRGRGGDEGGRRGRGGRGGDEGGRRGRGGEESSRGRGHREGGGGGGGR